MSDTSYILLGPDNTRQVARSLAYAKALAPQMLLRMGTLHSAQGGTITIHRANSFDDPIATYTTKDGWIDNTRHSGTLAA